MAIFKNEHNKDVLYVDCHCKCCEGLKIDVDRDDETGLYFLMSYTSGNFYNGQNSGVLCAIKNKLKKIWCIICNKDFYYSDISMTKEKFQEYKAFINSIE